MNLSFVLGAAKTVLRATKTPLLTLALTSVPAVIISNSAYGQTSGNWSVDANGLWSNAANWSSNPTVPGGAGSTIAFSNAITGSRITTIDTTSRTAGIVNFGYTGAFTWNLASSGGAGLIFDNGGSNAQLNMASSVNSTVTLAAPISLLSNLAVTNSTAARDLTITGAISSGSAGTKTITTSAGSIRLNGDITNGSGAVALNNTGAIVYLTGNNTFSGNVSSSAGRLFVGSNTATGSGILTVSGGRLGTTSATPVTLSNSSYVFGGSFEILSAVSAAVDLSLGTGGVSLTAVSGITVTNTNAHFKVGGNITESGGSRALSKLGTGTLSLSGNNTYSGGTTVSAGVLNLGSNTAVGTGTLNMGAAGANTFTVSSDSATARTLSNNVIFNTTGTATLGVDNTRGKLTFGNLTATQLGGLVVNSDVTFANLSGAANIVKTGTGILEFTGVRSGSGTLTIDAGTLLFNGTSSGTPGAVNINSGATLAGSGTLGGAVTIASGASFNPGNSPGTMIFNNDLTLNAGSTSNFEINGYTTGLYDLAQGGVGTQTVTFGGTLNLFFSNLPVGDVKIFDFENYAGSFSTVNFSGLSSGFTASFDELTGVVSVIPEPSSALALLFGLGLVQLSCRRRRSESAKL